MESLKERRSHLGISQRQVAALAGVSYKTIQLIEGGSHNVSFSTLEALATALGYPTHAIAHAIDTIFDQPPESVLFTSIWMTHEKKDWRISFFNFVDAFRRDRDTRYVSTPPSSQLSPQLAALLASAVESLCVELELPTPIWCDSIPPLPTPWFVADIENLKATALLESPVWFRKRNIFVLANFLERK